MYEVVFPNEVSAIQKQNSDWLKFIAELRSEQNYNEEYEDVTTAWGKPRQRLDNKWAYPCCPYVDYQGSFIEEYDKDNYPGGSYE